jgi:hypothetical protein
MSVESPRERRRATSTARHRRASPKFCQLRQKESDLLDLPDIQIIVAAEMSGRAICARAVQMSELWRHGQSQRRSQLRRHPASPLRDLSVVVPHAGPQARIQLGLLREFTTSLPSDLALAGMKRSNFANTQKSYFYYISCAKTMSSSTTLFSSNRKVQRACPFGVLGTGRKSAWPCSRRRKSERSLRRAPLAAQHRLEGVLYQLLARSVNHGWACLQSFDDPVVAPPFAA